MLQMPALHINFEKAGVNRDLREAFGRARCDVLSGSSRPLSAAWSTTLPNGLLSPLRNLNIQGCIPIILSVLVENALPTMATRLALRVRY